MQKFKIPLIAAGVIVLAILLYFLLVKPSGVYRAVPTSSVAVIETGDWNKLKLRLSNVTGNALKQTYALQKLLAQLDVLNKLLDGNTQLKEVAISGKTIASLHITSANNFDYLFISDVGSVSDNTLLNYLQASPAVKKVGVHVYRNQKIIDIQLRNGNQLSFGVSNGIMVLSATTFLTEAGIAALQSGDNLASDEGFKAVRKPTSADINLYFNPGKADVFFPVGVKPDRAALLADIKKTGTWGRFDVSLNDNQILVDGDVWTGSESPATAKKILDRDLPGQIPANAAYVEISRADTGGNAMIAPYFAGWVGDAKAFVVMEPLKEDFAAQNMFVVSVRNSAKALIGLKKMIAADGGQPLPVDTFLGYEIYSLTDGTVINQYWGNSLVTFDKACFVVTDKAAIFTPGADMLKLVLEKIANGQTLDKDAVFTATGYKQYGQNTSIHYMNMQYSSLMVRGLLNENSTIPAFLNEFGNVLLVTNHTDSKTSVHIVMATGGAAKAQAGLLWRTALKTTSIYQPQVIQNAVSGESEIFVQDTAHNVYLLSQSGAVLFSKNIGEPVVGKVHQIDYYNNGKVQYIFNTTGHVYVLDRFGNDVASYPLRLSAPAASGMVVNNNAGNTRYYVPCSNGNIYGYEANGKPLPGWSPKSGVGPVQQLECITTPKADNILAYTSTGKLYLFDSRGGSKWTISNVSADSKPISVVMLSNDFKVLGTTGAQLIEVAADGNENVRQLIDSASVLCAIGTGDTTYRYYYSTGGQIRAYDENDVFVGATSTGATITNIAALNWNGQQYLQVSDTSAGKLWLYDTALKPVGEFSYSNAVAATVADLFGRKEWIAVTTDKAASVSCYRIK